MRFGDWLITIMQREDLGWSGLLFDFLVQVQIYSFLLLLQCGAWSVRDLTAKINEKRNDASGSYGALELRPEFMT